MESHNIILFLLNNEILEKNEFQSDKFSLEKKGESNLIFYLNRLKNQDEHVTDNEGEAFFANKLQNAWIIKVKQNVSNLSDNLLVREALFFDIFKGSKLFEHFPEAHPKAKLGLFQNNTIVVRQFVENYRDAYRIFLNRKNTTKDELTFLKTHIVKNVAKSLRKFHETTIDVNSMRVQFANYLNPGELNINPIFLQEIPPLSKYKLAPVYIQFFWSWINNNRDKIQKLIDDANYEKKSNQLVHGDFRLPNILFSLRNKDSLDKTKNKTLLSKNPIEQYVIDFDSPLFIDFEYWHLGDQTWDMVCFFQNLKLLVPNNTNSYKKIFLDEYYGNALTDKIKAKIEATEKLFVIQNVYAELNETNYVVKIQELSKII
jgi:hypothetical protein